MAAMQHGEVSIGSLTGRVFFTIASTSSTALASARGFIPRTLWVPARRHSAGAQLYRLATVSTPHHTAMGIIRLVHAEIIGRQTG